MVTTWHRARRLLSRTWCRAADYAWIGRALAVAALRREIPPGYAAGTATPVMLLPGVLKNWAILRMVGDQLNLAGHPVHALRELGSNTVPVSEGARIVGRELVDRRLEDVMLVAHSKGGLIGKQVMLGPEGWRIRRLVAVATPFHGSRLAKLIPHPMVRAFDPHDPTIVELASRDEVDHRIVSICPSLDPHIPEGSHLAGATNVPVTASGHFRVLASPEVLAAIRQAVAEAA